ncbi:MAG: hypothetical protein HY315_06615 [Acidobacteria bacterium]|nr:hypothetical protein [Acidobacteriota bacterium]
MAASETPAPQWDRINTMPNSYKANVDDSAPDLFIYLGLFLTTLSLLQLELFLTRIFSVTMWYHFAFMAISLAMFGLAAGAVLVELRGVENARPVLAKAALLFAVSSAACFVAQLYIPVNPQQEILATALAFAVIGVPFIFAGIVVCVALTRFPGHTGSLYAADLAGSAAGCMLAIPILDHIPAPAAVIVNAGIAALGAFFFAVHGSGRTRRTALAASVLLVAIAAVNPWTRLVDLRWIKGDRYQGESLYEKWNALSRIWVGQAYGDPFGWGLSPKYKPEGPVDQRWLNIDANAATVITKFDGNLDTVQFLKYDVTALAHYLRPSSSILVIGAGGGRDILTALVFRQKRVVGVEINRDTLGVLTSRYADYSGNLHKFPGVSFVHDEARSYIARSTERFGIIQASLIDTWAATSAGAYALAENGLYTKEAWLTFLGHLEPQGILTMSRWYGETLRLASLATVSLTEMGLKDPRPHMIIVRKQDNPETGEPGVATILVSPTAFDQADITHASEVAEEMQFAVTLTPDYAESEEFAAVTDPARYAEFVRSYPSNISAPTDDSPFFFHTLRARDLLRPIGYAGMNVQAVKVLGALLVIVTLLSLGAIVLPLALRRDIRSSQSMPATIYFGAIGLAFMLVEIGQLERLVIFLGHPIYALSVVLFVLLFASSVGSFCSPKVGRWLWLLPVLLGAFILVSPWVTRALAAASTPVRIGLSALLLFPIGFFMGAAFPAGMERVRRSPRAPTAWYWGINGAFSVISSVLAVAVTIFWGVTATLSIGLLAYVLALAVLALERPRTG